MKDLQLPGVTHLIGICLFHCRKHLSCCLAGVGHLETNRLALQSAGGQWKSLPAQSWFAAADDIRQYIVNPQTYQEGQGRLSEDQEKVTLIPLDSVTSTN